MPAETQEKVQQLMEHLFRHQAGQMVASLSRVFGLENLDLAEEVVQEAMLKALRQWPFQGIPENPRAWLMQVARNQALDILRRRTAWKRKERELEDLIRARPLSTTADADDAELLDDQLAMVFACCHPSIPADARVALTLKSVGGLSIAEISRAFLTGESTVAQRLVRAKRRIEDEGIQLAIPSAPELPARLDSVLQVIYLLFNEGYAAHQGEDLVRHDLCLEALRLGLFLIRRAETSLPKVHALLSLMLLQASRLPARVDAQGDLLLISEQDRSLWDQDLIQRGMWHLDQASEGDELTEYHLQAAIASIHALAPDYQNTNWGYLVSLYDQMMQLAPSPVVALNRAVAVAMLEGPAQGLEALDAINPEDLRNYYLLPATRADLLLKLDRKVEAAQCYRQALKAPSTEPERRFLLKRLARCEE